MRAFSLKISLLIITSVILSCGGGGGGGGSTPDTLPNAPSSIILTPANTSIQIQWTDNSSNETSFIIERSLSAGGPFTGIADLTANTTLYNDSSLAPATPYFYHIFARNSAGDSGAITGDATTTNDSLVPAAPSALNGTADMNAITLSWSDNSADETAFVLERSSDGSTGWTQIGGDLAANTKIYTDNSLTPTTNYYYRIKAKNGAGLSTASASGIVTTLGAAAAVGSKHPTEAAAVAYSPIGEATWDSATWNAGSSFNAGNLEIAVYSKNATKVILEIYDSAYGKSASFDYDMKKNTADNFWRATIKSPDSRTLYAFRVWGPNWTYNASWTRGNSAAGFVSDVDSSGNRFNPNKAVYDPYAKELSHDKSNPTALGSENAGMYGTGAIADATSHGYSGACTGNVNIDRRNVDTGKFSPKSVAVNDTTSFGTKPAIAQKDAVIYEAHVRGLTMHESSSSLDTILSGIATVDSVPASYRGTYKGAGYMAKYLKALGVNTIELLPVHDTDNDQNPSNAAGGNYWGYMTYGYFAPDRRYAYDKSFGGPTKEFKEMIKSFHDEGIEVYLDVVYNHTGEGGNWDGTKTCDEITSFRGFDNSEYYALVDADKTIYWETTGCGNNFNASNSAVKNLIKDSLTYWISSMGVDGFRFDLGPVLGRDSAPNYNFNSGATLLTDIATIASTNNVEMIAEAWDTQWPGGYQVSNFPSGWGEWNGFFRDVVRKFIKADGWKVSGYPSLGDVFHGSYGPLDRSSGNVHTGFNDQGGPQKSVNFVDAHDGFTMMDIVSYGAKQNGGAWPFGASDGGSSDNDSWDSNPASHPGGAITTPAITQQQLRRQQLRNIFTILMFSRGVPMFVYGDEFGRTQNGNNNAYNLDSVCTWNNYNMINTDSPTAVALGSGFTGSYHNNFGTDGHADSKNSLFLFVKNILSIRNSGATSPLRQDNYSMDIFYATAAGAVLSASDRAARIHIDGTDVAGGNDYLVCLNMWKDAVSFTIPAAEAGKHWICIINTANYFEPNDNFWSDATASTISGTYGLDPMAVLVLKEVAD